MDVPEPVRRLALCPFHELPVPPDVDKVELDGAFISINPWPGAQIVGVRGSGPSDVGATVEAARAVARGRGKTIAAWWVPPDQDHVVPALEAAGLVNEDTPGFEAIENALALVAPPAAGGRGGRRGPNGRDLGRLRRRRAGRREGVRAATGPRRRTRARATQDYRHPGNPGRGFVALIGGRVVGTSYAAFGEAGVNLFGGSVLPEARGRGVYRALVQARWEAAAARGTPALTVQASRMSRPICERLGFGFLAPVRVFVDLL